jgi:hypothetical protein
LPEESVVAAGTGTSVPLSVTTMPEWSVPTPKLPTGPALSVATPANVPRDASSVTPGAVTAVSTGTTRPLSDAAS